MATRMARSGQNEDHHDDCIDHEGEGKETLDF